MASDSANVETPDAQEQDGSSAHETSASAGNKVAESIAKKGENSYYFAHSKPAEDLSQANCITGDGSRQLASLEGVQKITTEEVKTEEKITWREDYAFGDDGNKVKVYCEFPEGSLGHPDVKVETHFEPLKFQLILRGVGGGNAVFGITNGAHPLSGKIAPEKCQWRFNSSKSRLTITLFKEEPYETGWATLKKHVISQHTGWN
eukprot:CAMPEP_0172804164 /NCGR_PEP_ID=MMETSP1075-20121228/4980_1 /TAXON_ID=2916 /ORGANISM="Ceratium fusus, Strain PA161109" /LENGTH=203 /DNA_ID=CAMNT_0013642701 /DNA_START=54 /DNA_END=665 /DNA_ORIENTATION=-